MFTDEDLDLLKKFVREKMVRPDLDPTGEETIGFKYKMESLLARLEASEGLLNLWMHCDDDCTIDGSIFDAAMKKWRKSKGVEEGGK